MKLQELAYVLGDDGGIHRHIDDALKNMKKHAESSPSEDIRTLCKQAIAKLEFHSNNPASIHEDPSTFLKLISNLKGDPTETMLSYVVNSLGSYTQTDCE